MARLVERSVIPLYEMTSFNMGAALSPLGPDVEEFPQQITSRYAQYRQGA